MKPRISAHWRAAPDKHCYSAAFFFKHILYISETIRVVEKALGAYNRLLDRKTITMFFAFVVLFVSLLVSGHGSAIATQGIYLVVLFFVFQLNF